jgi:hypothetical protein
MLASIGDVNWTDLDVQARVKVLSLGGTTSSTRVGIFVRVLGTTQHYSFVLQGNGAAIRAAYMSSQGPSISTDVPEMASVGTWFTMRLVVRGATFQGFVNGVLVVAATETNDARLAAMTNGRVGVGTTNATAMFDDVMVTLP